MSTYRIVRFYANGHKHREDVGEGGLTLEEAQDHCSDDETSSSTCTSIDGTDRTARHGDWFEGYTEE